MVGPVEEINVHESSLDNRIKAIATDLSNYSEELKSIEDELQTQIDYVEALKKKANIAESVVNLNEDQVYAIQSLINEDETKNLVLSFLINALFFVLGFIVPKIINLIKIKLTKNSNEVVFNEYSDEEIAQAVELIRLMHQKNNKI